MKTTMIIMKKMMILCAGDFLISYRYDNIRF